MIIAFKFDDVDDACATFLGMVAYNVRQPFNIVSRPYSVSRMVNVKGVWVLELVPAWYRLDLYAWFMLPMLYILGVTTLWAYVPLMVMACIGLFWLPQTYMLGLWLGLRKSKSKSRLVWVKQSELVGVLCFGSD